jgi:phosphatidylethanolamine/phosphatidyl-N-methylethanolamine N-methyltransferase
MATTDLRLFLSSWLRAPMQIGALLPSSKRLAQAMAAQVDPRHEGVVVELGPGTGAVTQALLSRGVHASRLVLVERDPNFYHLLKNRFPGARVLQGDAGMLQQLLEAQNISSVSSVVSSLPLLSLPFSSQRQILRESFAVMVHNGIFVQFTYGFRSPVHPVLQRRLALVGHPVARVFRNLPPAVAWQYTQRRKSGTAYPRLAA